jgi:flagellar protein FliO/FliZ
MRAPGAIQSGLCLLLTAAGPASTAWAGESGVPGGASSAMQVISALFLVMAAIGALAWILRLQQKHTGASQPFIKIVATLGLGPRERLVIVESGESWLLLGVTGQGIQLLQSLPRQALPASPQDHSRLDFSRVLSRALGKHDPR